jgi:hypothetical protein
MNESVVGSEWRAELEDRVLRSGRQKFGGGRVRTHAIEELTDFPLPTAQVRTEDLRLVGIGDLEQLDVLDTTTDAKIDRTGCPSVQHPLGDAPRGDEIPAIPDREDVHRSRANLARHAARDLEHT